MPYAILRFQKRKAGGVAACERHNERKKEAYKSNPDIDMERSKNNYHLVAPPRYTYKKEINRKVAEAGCRTRKDSVMMVETLITASPEFMNQLPPEEQKEYFTLALDFISERVGEKNILSAVVHMDERTPHMHLCFVPITPDNKLSAKTILGNLDGQDSMVTVFEVQRDGLIGAVTFIYRKGELQTYYIGIRWREGGMPEIQGTSVSNVAEIKLTEKGYFIYAYEYVIAHASLRQYWRIEPLPEDCQELTEKYISGLSYVNYNLLVTDWDSSNVEDILMPCMYEDVYRISTGENLKTEGWKIPAEEYERIMTTYFPVSVEQLREHCGYDEGSNSYEYEMIYASPYPPFGEVVDYTKNADGTITLIVDGVWPDYNSDLAFRNTVVVQPFEDGTFRYLSNSIEQIELELPPIAKAH